MTVTPTLRRSRRLHTRARLAALIAAAGVDLGKWHFETDGDVNNHERERHTSGAGDAALDGQHDLVITAKRENPGSCQRWYGPCEHTSARLSTAGQSTQAYGHVEARVKIRPDRARGPRSGRSATTPATPAGRRRTRSAGLPTETCTRHGLWPT